MSSPTPPWAQAAAEDIADFLIALLKFIGSVKAIALDLPDIAVGPDLQNFQYKINSERPVQKLPLDALVTAVLKGVLASDTAAREALSHGFDDTTFKTLVAAGRALPNLAEILELWRRGTIEEEEALERVTRLGFEDETAATLLTLRDHIPGVADIITWLVRDVLDPEIRESLGLDLEYPEAATALMSRVGVSEENAQRYWAAHWQLPSITLAFEMYHRNLITREDLEFLMKAHDILPRYREQIVNAAYRPLTRVDVRRMHDMGVLDDEGVHRAYSDIGYSPHNADLMVAWTKLYNADLPESVDAEEAKSLTRSQILKLLRNGSYDSQQAHSALMEIGYTEQLAGVLVANEEIDLIDRQRSEFVQTVTAQYSNGVIDYERATGLIAGSGLEGNELNFALTRLGVPEEAQVSEPSQGQLNRFLKQGLLPPQQYLDLMVRRGYSFEWAAMFYESYRSGTSEDYISSQTADSLRTQYVDAEISYEQWREAMADLGYSEPFIAHFADRLPVDSGADDE